MGSEWRTTTIGELAEIYDGPHATPTPVPEGPIFLGISCLDRGRLDLSKADHLTEADLGRWTRRVTPTANDVVFSYETRIGEAAKIPPDFRGCLGRRMGLLRPRMTVDPDFLLYAFLGPGFQETLRSRTVHGSTVDRILLTELGDLPIRVPPLAEQRHIGAALKALDDKIELNRRMSQTLESMARVLFKSWFVDFDPVRAKSEGRDPGLLTQVADLFPDTFEDTDQGAIPRSWRDSTVGEEFHVTMGQSPPGETYNEAALGLPFYQGRADFGVRFPSRRVYCTAPTRFARPGDTLVCVRAPVGDTNLAVEDCAIGRGLAAVRHKSGASSYTFLAMRSLSDSFEAFESEGTVFGSINKQGFGAMRVTSPSIPVVLTFEQLVWPIDAQVQGAHSQATLLAEIRDSLLPAMMSGQGGPVAARSGDMDR